MRKRKFAILAVVMCFLMHFGLLGAEARTSIRVRHVPKRKVGIAVKTVGSFSYNAKLNRWESDEGKKPVIFKPWFIGPNKLPAYYESGNTMADPCDDSMIIITDQSYAIGFSTDCSGEPGKRLRRYVKSYTLPKGVHAVRAKEEKGWEVIE
jgi:hypothetical protein